MTNREKPWKTASRVARANEVEDVYEDVYNDVTTVEKSTGDLVCFILLIFRIKAVYDLSRAETDAGRTDLPLGAKEPWRVRQYRQIT